MTGSSSNVRRDLRWARHIASVAAPSDAARKLDVGEVSVPLHRARRADAELAVRLEPTCTGDERVDRLPIDAGRLVVVLARVDPADLLGACECCEAHGARALERALLGRLDSVAHGNGCGSGLRSETRSGAASSPASYAAWVNRRPPRNRARCETSSGQSSGTITRTTASPRLRTSGEVTSTAYPDQPAVVEPADDGSELLRDGRSLERRDVGRSPSARLTRRGTPPALRASRRRRSACGRRTSRPLPGRRATARPGFAATERRRRPPASAFSHASPIDAPAPAPIARAAPEPGAPWRIATATGTSRKVARVEHREPEAARREVPRLQAPKLSVARPVEERERQAALPRDHHRVTLDQLEQRPPAWPRAGSARTRDRCWSSTRSDAGSAPGRAR